MARRSRGMSALRTMTVADLHAEIARRQRSTRTLHAKRRRLLASLAKIESAIRAAGDAVDGSAGRRAARGRRRVAGRRVRPKNAMNLAQALARLLKGRTMGVTEASVAVRKAGYRTNAENFRTMVNQALIKHRNLFKKVSRGQYTAAE